MSNNTTLPITTHIDQSLTCPLALIAFSSLMEEINSLWEEAYTICKSDVKSLTKTAFTLHLNYLNYMRLVCYECTQGRNSLENIHSELKIAFANGEFDRASALEIIESANNLLDVFKNLSDQNKVIKKDIDDCKNNIEEREKSFSRKALTSNTTSKLSLSGRVRTALFAAAAGVAATDLLYDTIGNPLVLGASAATLAVISSSTVCNIFQPSKVARLRTILESLKKKIEVLFDHVDSLGVKITEIVSELEVYTKKTEHSFDLNENYTGERMRVKGQSLVESTLALKLGFNQISEQAKEHSRYIRNIIRLGNASDLIKN